MYEHPTKKARSLTADIINAADNGNLVAKIKITQKVESVDYSTTHEEEAFLEKSKASTKFLIKK